MFFRKEEASSSVGNGDIYTVVQPAVYGHYGQTSDLYWMKSPVIMRKTCEKHVEARWNGLELRLKEAGGGVAERRLVAKDEI